MLRGCGGSAGGVKGLWEQGVQRGYEGCSGTVAGGAKGHRWGTGHHGWGAGRRHSGVQRYCSWDAGTPGGYGVKQRAWLGLQQLRYWGEGAAWAEGQRGAGSEGCWILWLGAQGVQGTTARGAEQCGEGVQGSRGRVQGQGVQGTLAWA